MKQLYTSSMFILCIFFTGTIYSQNIQYDLRCSADGTSYEVYISRDADTSFPFALASSTITLVLPTGSTRTVSHTSESVATYSQVTPTIDGDGTGNDYYPFNSSGGSQVSFTANMPVLWLTLIPSDGTDQEARLIINGSDPDDFLGANPSNVFNTISIAGLVNEYSGNVSDVAINCSTLSTGEEVVTANPEISVYPNPFSDILNIEVLGDIQNVELFDVGGKKVYSGQARRKLFLRHLQDGVYILKVEYNGQSVRKRVVKY